MDDGTKRQGAVLRMLVLAILAAGAAYLALNSGLFSPPPSAPATEQTGN